MGNLDAVEDARAEVEEYRRRLQRDPDSLRFAEFANHLRRAGLTSDATAICARGLIRHPGYATGHVVMGEIFRDADLIEKAEREWREALRLDPGHPLAHLCLGELCLSRGEVEQAETAFRAALASNPNLAEARTKLAELTGEASTQTASPTPASDGDRSWEPGERPDWLASSRFDDLVARVGACASVQTAALANSDGLLLAGDMPEATDPAASAVAAAELMSELRDLLVRIAAGRLRAAVLAGDEGIVHCVALGDLTLVAGLKTAKAIDSAPSEIGEALRGAS